MTLHIGFKIEYTRHHMQYQGMLIVRFLLLTDLCFLFLFSVVEKLQAIMTEVETAMNSFKLDQHQRFVTVCRCHM